MYMWLLLMCSDLHSLQDKVAAIYSALDEGLRPEERYVSNNILYVSLSTWLLCQVWSCRCVLWFFPDQRLVVCVCVCVLWLFPDRRLVLCVAGRVGCLKMCVCVLWLFPDRRLVLCGLAGRGDCLCVCVCVVALPCPATCLVQSGRQVLLLVCVCVCSGSGRRDLLITCMYALLTFLIVIFCVLILYL